MPDESSTSERARRRLALASLGVAAGAMGLALVFSRAQNADPTLGGAIAASKTVWLFTAVGLWFFVCPLVAASRSTPPELRPAFGAFGALMWARGVVELYLLYGPKVWTPWMGISHDALCALVLGVMVARARGTSSAPGWSRSSSPSLFFFVLLLLSLAIEIHHAYHFLELVQDATKGDRALWFASEADPRFAELLRRTRAGNVLILGGVAGWLFLLVRPLRRGG